MAIDRLQPNTPAIYTAPSGDTFKCIVVTGRLDPVFNDYLIRRDDSGKLCYASPVRLELINEA
jgi:hypothetical protein